MERESDLKSFSQKERDDLRKPKEKKIILEEDEEEDQPVEDEVEAPPIVNEIDSFFRPSEDLDDLKN